jgi:hypothetical protein
MRALASALHRFSYQILVADVGLARLKRGSPPALLFLQKAK